MANKRITELGDIGTPSGSDVLEIVDVSDTTDSPEGTSKKVLVSALSGGGGAVTSVNGDTGAVVVDLESVLTEGGTATDLGIVLDNTSDSIVINLDCSTGLLIDDGTNSINLTNNGVAVYDNTGQSVSIVKDKLWAYKSLKELIGGSNYIDYMKYDERHEKYIRGDKQESKLGFIEQDRIWRERNNIPHLIEKKKN